MLTPAQLQALKADILANSDLNIQPMNSDGAFEIARRYNLAASPAFYVWRTNVTRSEIYHIVSTEGTSWSWTTYKNQGATEQNAWVQMFMGDQADFSKDNLRAGIAALFTGSAQANAQRDHCLAAGKRTATRAEKLFATGTGSQASPARRVDILRRRTSPQLGIGDTWQIAN